MKQEDQDRQRSINARVKNDTRRYKTQQREQENALKAKKQEDEMRRRQDELERRDKERQDFLEQKNNAKKQLSVEMGLQKQEKITIAREHNEQIIGEQHMYIMEKERQANMKRHIYEQKREIHNQMEK